MFCLNFQIRIGNTAAVDGGPSELCGVTEDPPDEGGARLSEVMCPSSPPTQGRYAVIRKEPRVPNVWPMWTDRFWSVANFEVEGLVIFVFFKDHLHASIMYPRFWAEFSTV